jgi:hypothetical protein
MGTITPIAKINARNRAFWERLNKRISKRVEKNQKAVMEVIEFLEKERDRGVPIKDLPSFEAEFLKHPCVKRPSKNCTHLATPLTMNVRRKGVQRAFEDVLGIYQAVATTEDGHKMAPLLASIGCFLYSDSPDAGPAPKQFCDVNDESVRKELIRLSRLSEESNVAAEIKSIHQPTIAALANSGFVGAQRPEQKDIVILVSAAKRAVKARAYRRPCAKPKGKRPTNMRVAAARIMLREHYKLLTGEEPTIIHRTRKDVPGPDGNTLPGRYGTRVEGGFFEFVDKMFKALNISGSAEAQAREIVYPRS